MGGAIGALLGALAGLPGIVAGALLGAVAGGAAGRVIDVQGSRASRHDADLDDEIGVTSGSLGRTTLPPADHRKTEAGERP